MKSFQPGYAGSSPWPARPVVVTSRGCARVAGVPHRGAVPAGVGAEAGVVEVPLVPGRGRGRRLHARLAGRRRRPRRGGRGRAGRRSRRCRCCRPRRSRRRCSRCRIDAGDGVRAGGARGAASDARVGGSVTSTTISSPPPTLAVLDVARAGLDEVDADQREAAATPWRCLPLAAVHRLVLELQRREHAGQGRVGRRRRRPRPGRSRGRW